MRAPASRNQPKRSRGSFSLVVALAPGFSASPEGAERPRDAARAARGLGERSRAPAPDPGSRGRAQRRRARQRAAGRREARAAAGSRDRHRARSSGAERADLAAARGEPGLVLAERVTDLALDQLAQGWLPVQAALDAWSEAMARHASAVEAELAGLTARQDLWQRSLDALLASDEPPEIEQARESAGGLLARDGDSIFGLVRARAEQGSVRDRVARTLDLERAEAILYAPRAPGPLPGARAGPAGAPGRLPPSRPRPIAPGPAGRAPGDGDDARAPLFLGVPPRGSRDPLDPPRRSPLASLVRSRRRPDPADPDPAALGPPGRGTERSPHASRLPCHVLPCSTWLGSESGRSGSTPAPSCDASRGARRWR